MSDDPLWQKLTRLTPARIGLGRAGAGLPTREVLKFGLAHAQARDAVHVPMDAEAVAAAIEALGFSTLRVASRAEDRATYLRRPDWGRTLDEESERRLAAAVNSGRLPGSKPSSHPHPHPEVASQSDALEGALQNPPQSLEPSFEAADATPQDEGSTGRIPPSPEPHATPRPPGEGDRAKRGGVGGAPDPDSSALHPPSAARPPPPEGEEMCGVDRAEGGKDAIDLALVVADGLSARAVHEGADKLLAALNPHIDRNGWNVAPVVIAAQARVALGDAIGAALGARIVAVVIGERPGLSSPDSLGIYVTYQPRPGRSDAERNCISNVRPAGLAHEAAAARLAWLIEQALARGLTGVQLKDASDEALEAASTERLSVGER